MKQIVAGLMAAALLGGCGGGSNPFERSATEDESATDGGTTDDGTTDGGTTDDGSTDGETNTDGDSSPTVNTEVAVPEELAGNVRSVSFDAATQTLVVEALNLDDVPVRAVYRRRPGLDRNGYVGFSVQNDPLDRHFTAFAKESSNSNSVRAAVVGSGGPRNIGFRGGFFERDGDYTPPEVSETTGLVSYAGRYVGISNIGVTNGSDLAEIPVDLLTSEAFPEELRPTQAVSVDGKVFINADFADNSVEGNVFDRRLVETNTRLPSVVLVTSPIAGNGTFNGDVEIDSREDLNEDGIADGSRTVLGSYGGVFGGPNADAVAGIINLDDLGGGPELEDLGLNGELLETGIFVLDQCGQTVDAELCNLVNPDVASP
ncbi:hypothetical protein [uncultured Roseovarius sp.]|uniref:hypothetical protein n=1 Tax=uncultured Roseovarius sp. TaxID=293344 RepID=UPI002620AC99|nr:hypothetical protein [uncultured Roseovarius sp.]